MERFHLICMAWSEHAKNIPQLAFWPIITGLWNVRSEGPGVVCLTSLQCKISPNASDPLHSRQWGPRVDLTRFTACITSTDTASACIQCAVSLNYFSRHPRSLPAVSPLFNLTVTSPKNTPSLSRCLSQFSAFIQRKSLSSGTMTAKGSYQRIILKSGCNPSVRVQCSGIRFCLC